MTDATVTRDALHNLCQADPVWAERYEGWAELGRGGSACVIRTHSRATGELIALKVFHHLAAEDVRRFQQEVRSAQRLTSPFIVRTYSPFPRGPLAWIEMELVEGGDLRRVLEDRAREGRPFSRDEALEIAVALAEALVAAHEAGVVHRDVKPANVLLPASGRPVAKLGDFGISRVIGSTRVTATGLLAGTPQFAAPEVIVGEEARPPSDVYSLGLTLYRLLSNDCSPFSLADGASAGQWLRAQGEASPLPLRHFAPSIDRDLEALVGEALAKDPARRPTAREMLDGLHGLLARTASIPRPRRSHAGRRWPIAVAAACAAAAIAAAATGMFTIIPPAAEGTLAVPVRSHPVPASVPPAAEPPSVEVSLIEDRLTVTNRDGEELADLHLTLTGPGAARPVASGLGGLVPGEELTVVLDAFTPPPPSSWRPEAVEIAAAGRAPWTVLLRNPSRP
jgi:serine/threonine protein kinase